MVNPLAVVRTYLLTNIALTTLVATRIYWGTTMPAGYTVDTGPALLLNMRGGGQDFSSKVLTPTISVQCIARDDAVAMQVAQALYDALNDHQDYLIMEARQSIAPQLIFDPSTEWVIALVYYEASIRNP